MADRYDSTDMAIFDAGAIPDHTWAVTMYPGQFYDTSITVTDLVIGIEGIDFRLGNVVPQQDSKIHYPPCRLTLINENGKFAPEFYFPNEITVKRTKFRLVLSTPSTGTMMDLWVSLVDYRLDDDNVYTFDCQHPLYEWDFRRVIKTDADTGESTLIPNT